MVERLKNQYKEEILPELIKKLKLNTPMEAPRLVKISVNSGVGGFNDSREALNSFREELTDLLGQTPRFCRAKKAISGFKIQKGDIVGISATLHGDKMWSFVDKLVNIVLPRVRDFRGLGMDAFDSHGNYSIGLEDHTIFPEVNTSKVKVNRGLQINIVTNSKSVEEAELLLRKLGFPLKKKE